MRVIALALVITAACAAPSARRASMPTFALLFRASAQLAPDELAHRNAAARDWALARQHDGVLRFPAPLDDVGYAVTRDGVAPSRADIAAVLIIEAPDLDAAVALARTHPGLAYGTEIDVHPVKTAAAAVTK
jgi:hypothetical protein